MVGPAIKILHWIVIMCSLALYEGSQSKLELYLKIVVASA